MGFLRNAIYVLIAVVLTTIIGFFYQFGTIDERLLTLYIPGALFMGGIIGVITLMAVGSEVFEDVLMCSMLTYIVGLLIITWGIADIFTGFFFSGVAVITGIVAGFFFGMMLRRNG